MTLPRPSQWHCLSKSMALLSGGRLPSARRTEWPNCNSNMKRLQVARRSCNNARQIPPSLQQRRIQPSIWEWRCRWRLCQHMPGPLTCTRIPTTDMSGQSTDARRQPCAAQSRQVICTLRVAEAQKRATRKFASASFATPLCVNRHGISPIMP